MKDILFEKFVTSCSKIRFQQHMWLCTGCQKPLLLIVLDDCTGFVTIKFIFISVGCTGVQEKIIQSQSSHLVVGIGGAQYP
jgi:hypothetical protein